MARKNKGKMNVSPKPSVKKTRKDRKKPIEQSIVIKTDNVKNLFPIEQDDEVTIVQGPPKPDPIVYVECDLCGELQWQRVGDFTSPKYVSCDYCCGGVKPASIAPPEVAYSPDSPDSPLPSVLSPELWDGPVSPAYTPSSPLTAFEGRRMNFGK